MKRKAAVVIGVNKPGSYTPLKSAVTGAEEVSDWLKGEGYQVQCLTDQTEPVTSRNVEDAISAYVTNPPTYHQLVIYFSGHGIYHARSDVWLLSGAPERTNEAINLEGAMQVARYSGIKNIVFISDACRVNPHDRPSALINGIDAFPNYSDITSISDIDYFKATCESLPAYEGEIDGKIQGFLTYALKSAYESPETEMVREVMVGDKTLIVVPNRQLKNYLQLKVNNVSSIRDGKLWQQLDIRVPSDDDIYISRVFAKKLQKETVKGVVDEYEFKFNEAAVKNDQSRLSEESLIFSVGDLAAEIIPIMLANSSRYADIKSMLRTFYSDDHPYLAKLIKQLGKVLKDKFDLDVSFLIDPIVARLFEARLPKVNVNDFKSGCGFILYGEPVDLAVCTQNESNDAKVEVQRKGEGKSKSTIIQVWNPKPAVSVAIKFANGKCSILPALAGYIGHVTYENEGVSNVSYTPHVNHRSFLSYKYEKRRIDHFRAIVALAVDCNTFTVNSDNEATQLANKIRTKKMIDPTLGLYAAYAFSQAGEENFVLGVLNEMRADLEVDLFDVQLLASREIQHPINISTVPFCPILTQSWNLMRPRGIELPKPMGELTQYLCNSLWTTFEKDATDTIINAINKGELK